MSVTFTDNSAQYLAQFERACQASLEAVGNQAVSHAKQNLRAARGAPTGNLINSISHQVVGDSVHIGSNVRYAIYNEMGTGIYIAGGRKTPWVYQDGRGEWHRTSGMRPVHFLKNAVANHLREYKAIIERIFKG